MTPAGPRSGFSVRPDDWLTGLLGRPALSVAVAAESWPAGDWESRLTAEPLFATAKLPVSETAAAGVLQGLGFRIVDAALSFTAPTIAAAGDDPRVRFAKPADRDAVIRIAAGRLTFSRFHLDPDFPRALAGQLKSAWAGNFFAGRRGDGMVVAECKGRVVGFLLLIWVGTRLVIDLIAIAADAARQGLARALIGFAAGNGTGDGRRADGYSVGTQAANIGAVRLYESLGFRLAQASFVLHHHGRGGRYPEEIRL